MTNTANYTIKVTGNTFAHKDWLKVFGFTYVPRFYDFNKGENVKAFWYREFEGVTAAYIDDMAQGIVDAFDDEKIGVEYICW